MATNLLETLRAQFGDELINQLSQFTSEQPAQTRTAIERASDATLAGLIHRGATPNGPAALADTLNEARFSGDSLNDLLLSLRDGSSLTALIEQGKALLHSLFGDRVDGLTQWIASNSGVGKNSATSLLGLVAPLVLNFISRQFNGKADGRGVLAYLNGQRGFLEKSAPAGLLPVLGWRDWTVARTESVPPAVAPPERAVVDENREVVVARSSRPWWLWPLVALSLLILGFLLLRSCDRTGTVSTTAPPVQTTTPVTPVTPPAQETVVVDTVKPVELLLPDGTRLLVLPDGVEQRLTAFIEDGNKIPDETTWFTVNNLEFETGSATLKASSQERLKNIAALLKAYPSVHIKIGGYTDNTGDPATNLKLSDDRARSVMQGLVNLGVDAGRLEAEGYGEQYPVAPNTTEEGRQKNRRVDLRVTAKKVTAVIPVAPSTSATAPAVSVTPTTPAVTTAPPVTEPALTAELVEILLPDKVRLKAFPGSIEQRLVGFIEDGSKAPDETTWFTFDGLEFETGSATLVPSSRERLKQVAAVLKAYPKVHIKIGGYTDNVGEPQMNLKLSNDRAQSAKQELVKLGIAADRLEAEGYGEQHPVADNATEEGRKSNRRVDIRVTAK